MIIKALGLKNIRSYEDARLEFAPGRTLFEGDIGSGKSTLLMAIEFAFFGLGSEQGGAMLRVGEDAGEVALSFSVEGTDYTVTRRLERKGSRVQQGPGTLETNGQVVDYSPSELKERVLEVLGFNEAPDPKAQSWIYRYAVYTPQEEMKSVLSLTPELRLQILRRAFRLEDYKIAAENAEEVAREVRATARVRDAEAAGVEALREQLESLGREQARYLESVTTLRGREEELDRELTAQRGGVKALQEAKMRIAGLKAEKALQERAAAEARGRVRELDAELDTVRLRRAELLKEISETAAKAVEPGRSVEDIDLAIGEAQSKVARLAELKGMVGSKVSDYESILKDGMCPVCDREVEAHDFGKRKEAKEGELRHVAEELERAERDAGSLRDERERAQARAREVERLAGLKEELAEAEETMAAKEEARAAPLKRQAEAEERVMAIASEIGGSRDAEEKLAALEETAEKTEKALKKAREQLAADKRDLELSARRQKEIGAEMESKEKSRKLRDAALERSIYLGDYFIPTVRLVERSVLGAINQEFDGLFRKWFAMLVGDSDKEARVDEDFTPRVSQGGYEQDVWYLSGGERTSVALAYRLALNTLTQRVAAAMRSNLLILDEPTDGFSKEQLSNVRDVLDDLASPQVIMVSHDRELESFADQIVRVSKSAGRSVLEDQGSG